MEAETQCAPHRPARAAPRSPQPTCTDRVHVNTLAAVSNTPNLPSSPTQPDMWVPGTGSSITLQAPTLVLVGFQAARQDTVVKRTWATLGPDARS